MRPSSSHQTPRGRRRSNSSKSGRALTASSPAWTMQQSSGYPSLANSPWQYHRGGMYHDMSMAPPIPPPPPSRASSADLTSSPSKQGGVRYVDIRGVAIPGDTSPYPPQASDESSLNMRYSMQSPSPSPSPYHSSYGMMGPSPLTVASNSHSMSYIHERGAMTPSPTMRRGSSSSGPHSFLPIHHQQQDIWSPSASSSAATTPTAASRAGRRSPYDFNNNKAACTSPSPSVMSYDTLETASMTLDTSHSSSTANMSTWTTPTSMASRLRQGSPASSNLSTVPAGLANLVPPLYRPSPTESNNSSSLRSSRSSNILTNRLESSPRPKTPTQRPKTPTITAGSRPKTPTTLTSTPRQPSPRGGGSGPKTPTITTPSSLQLALLSATPGNSGRSASTGSTSTAGGSAGRKSSPFVPKSNLEAGSDDLVRKSRLKTEMCMHYAQGRPCPFGSQCTYAHGVEELQMTKLLDLGQAGLVDVETHRTRPCFSWVATGCCPFGKRCTGIHDPRVAGTSSSWLTHTETQGNTIATDINVESMHQKLHHHIHHGTPFGEQFSLLSDSWSDLYKKVCNMDSVWIDQSSKQSSRGGRGGGNGSGVGASIHPICKLQIALALRGNSEWLYKYRPQHMIYDELCMVLQKRAFRLINSSSGRAAGGNNKKKGQQQHAVPDSAVEITLKAYNPRLTNHVLVHEIAFGPDQDSTVRGVALWFNIDESQVVECTSAQAKRFRWKKGINKKQDNNDMIDYHTTNNKSSGKHSNGNNSTKSSMFDHLDSFAMIRPHDADAFNLATDIMKHRLAFLTKERMSSMKDRFEALSVLEVEKKALQERFNHIKRHWMSWAWPVNAGREYVDKRTPVPSIDGKYEPPKSSSCMLTNKVMDSLYQKDSNNDDPSNVVGENVIPVWNAFVHSGCGVDKTTNTGGQSNKVGSSNVKAASTGRRLRIFEDLADGIPVSMDRTLPHLIKSNYQGDRNNNRSRKNKAKGILPSRERQQERCWKALLLKVEENRGANEWDLVREHFENSRSKKVLSILQQK